MQSTQLWLKFNHYRRIHFLPLLRAVIKTLKLEDHGLQYSTATVTRLMSDFLNGFDLSFWRFQEKEKRKELDGLF